MSNGERFDSDVQVKLPPLEPARTKAGTIKIHRPRIPKRSTTWWSAQCIFRGLPASGNVEDKHKRIRGALAEPMSNVMVMVRVLKYLEAKMHAEFLVKNAEARDQEWLTLDRDAKISKDPERFLRESSTMDTKSGGQGCCDTYSWPLHDSRNCHTYW
jgi:hypothetical protein